MKYIIGTRGSKLAVAQTSLIIELLKAEYPEDVFESRIISTKGDRVQHIPLEKIGDKGVFVKEIETALLKKEIDLAVHSLKDLPSEQPDGLVLSDPIAMERANDCLIINETRVTMEHGSRPDLNGRRIGTGSKRRAFQLKQLYPKAEIVPIRGNVDTRLKKMYEQNLDAIIMAEAGIHRLALDHLVAWVFRPEEIVPACGQGIIAVELREEDLALKQKIDRLSDCEAKLRKDMERAFLKQMDGSCHIPVGACCEIKQNEIRFHYLYGDEEGKQIIKGMECGICGQQEELLRRAVEQCRTIRG